ncbi:hypothetical protein I4U23_004834 [Adineta vaga]|nr:hypothetical protein I4U23_004834 [Adineta vaga]
MNLKIKKQTMLVLVALFLLVEFSIDASEIQFGLAKQYMNTNYNPLIVENLPLLSKTVSSKLRCLSICFNENDCTLSMFNRTNNQCMIYNRYPNIQQEFFSDNDIIVSIIERTIQLSPLISNISWILSRLNTTNIIHTIPIAYARSVAMDLFDYFLTLEAYSGVTYVNRYDSTNLKLIKRTPLPITSTSSAILTYYNKMIFISASYNIIYIFDHVNFTLLGNITCDFEFSEPRNIIFLESQQLMIIVSYINSKIIFFHINSPTNYTYFNSTSLPGGAQALLKINDTFFQVTTYNTGIIYNFKLNGQIWISSLFVNVSETSGVSNVRLASLHIDHLQRRWVMLSSYGLAVYDQWGNYLDKWKVGIDPFDIFILNDYRVAIAQRANANFTLYNPQILI